MTATPNLSRRHYIIHSMWHAFYALCVIFPSWSVSGGRIGSRVQTGRLRTDCAGHQVDMDSIAVWFTSDLHCPRVALSALRAITDHRTFVISV